MTRFSIYLEALVIVTVMPLFFSCASETSVSGSNLSSRVNYSRPGAHPIASELSSLDSALRIGSFYLIFGKNSPLRAELEEENIIFSTVSSGELRINVVQKISSPLEFQILSDDGLVADYVSVMNIDEADQSTFGVLISDDKRGISEIYFSSVRRAEVPPSTLLVIFRKQASHERSISYKVFGNPVGKASSKVVSRAFEGSKNQVTDLSASPSDGGFSLRWKEKNKGDYNNDGKVTIADVRPLALHFFHTSPYNGNEPRDALDALIDGNEDGEIDIQDVQEIALNFFSFIAGYDVFIVPLESIDDEVTEKDFLASGSIANPYDPNNPRPTVPRSNFYTDGLPPSELIEYTFNYPLSPGIYAVAVRSYSDEDDNYDSVPFSNFEKFEISSLPVNQPPQWTNPSEPGVLSFTSLDGGARITFGDSFDPDGDEIIYRIFIKQGPSLDPSDPTVTRIDVLRSDLTSTQTPPFTYDVGALVNGLFYSAMVRIYDAHGLEESPPNSVVATFVPHSSAPNPLPWPYFRKDEARTGLSVLNSLHEPLEEVWRRTYKDFGSFSGASPVLDEALVYIASVDGAVWAFDQITGELKLKQTLSPGSIESTSALYGDYLIQGVRGRYLILTRDEDGGMVQFSQFSLESPLVVHSSPVIIGGLIYAGSNEGDVYAFSLDGFQLWRQDLGVSRISSSPTTDGEFLYVANDEGFVFKLSLDSGEIVDFSNDLGDISFTSPIPFPPENPSYILIGSDYDGQGDNGVFRLNAQDFKDSVKLATNRGIRCTPLVIQNGATTTVVVGDFNPGLVPDPETRIYAFNLETGEKLWETPPTTNIGGVVSSPVATGDRIFVATATGLLYVFDYDGNQMGQALNVGGAVYTTPAIRENWIYLTNSLAEIVAFRTQ